MSSNQHRGAVKGFTLIELLVVISIVALLISILLPLRLGARAWIAHESGFGKDEVGIAGPREIKFPVRPRPYERSGSADLFVRTAPTNQHT